MKVYTRNKATFVRIVLSIKFLKEMRFHTREAYSVTKGCVGIYLVYLLNAGKNPFVTKEL